MNTILKEMGHFSASSEWLEWIHFHSKWVSYWPGPGGFNIPSFNRYVYFPNNFDKHLQYICTGDTIHSLRVHTK